MLRTNQDAILCLLWMLTYTLVLIATEKYKYPVISPITQIFIASLEFSVLLELFLDGGMGWNHIWISYLYWGVIEIVIIVRQIEHRYIPREHIWKYMGLLVLATVGMCYLVVCKGHGFFFTHFNTLVGEIIWLFHIRNKNYPMKPLVLLMFTAKFVADTIGILVNWDRGTLLANIICVLLPILDFMFIHVYFRRKAEVDHTTESDIVIGDV